VTERDRKRTIKATFSPMVHLQTPMYTDGKSCYSQRRCDDKSAVSISTTAVLCSDGSKWPEHCMTVAAVQLQSTDSRNKICTSIACKIQLPNTQVTATVCTDGIEPHTK